MRVHRDRRGLRGDMERAGGFGEAVKGRGREGVKDLGAVDVDERAVIRPGAEGVRPRDVDLDRARVVPRVVRGLHHVRISVLVFVREYVLRGLFPVRISVPVYVREYVVRGLHPRQLVSNFADTL